MHVKHYFVQEYILDMARVGAIITLMLALAACVAAGLTFSRDLMRAAAICGFAALVLFIISTVLFLKKPVHRKDGTIPAAKKA